MGYLMPASEKPPGGFLSATIDHCYVAIFRRRINLSSLYQGGKCVLAKIGDEYFEHRLAKFDVLLDYPFAARRV